MRRSKCFIDSKYLLTLTEVAKYRSVTAASESLFMTQPAVSQHIKKIENTVGVEVFDRKGGFDLTQHGRVVFEHAKKTLSMNEDLFEQLKNVNLGSRLNIAIEDIFCPRVIEFVVNKFKELNYRELSFTSFSLENTPPLKDYDMIFTTKMLPKSKGTSHHLDTASYVIVRHNTNYKTPARVVFSNTLTKSYVRNVLREHDISQDDIVYWHMTSSSTLMKNELEVPRTIVVCPDWSVASSSYVKTPFSQLVNMYVWSCDDAATKFKTFDISTNIKKFINEAY
ncbi:LysR family transcriptional regulator [Vibrio pectenicida]|uniref:LysR family transcriptional regulator n=1 Tax=Vibrio pectenicida TaxID=62763 RepID=UPI003B9C7BEC